MEKRLDRLEARLENVDNGLLNFFMYHKLRENEKARLSLIKLIFLMILFIFTLTFFDAKFESLERTIENKTLKQNVEVEVAKPQVKATPLPIKRQVN